MVWPPAASRACAVPPTLHSHSKCLMEIIALFWASQVSCRVPLAGAPAPAVLSCDAQLCAYEPLFRAASSAERQDALCAYSRASLFSW